MDYLQILINRYNNNNFGDDFECKTIITNKFNEYDEENLCYLHMTFPQNTTITILIMISVPEEHKCKGICINFIKYLEENCNSDYIIIGPIMSDSMNYIICNKLLGYKPIPPFSVYKKLR